MGAESDVVIFVASGNSAVSDAALVLGGRETGGDDTRALVVGDVVAARGLGRNWTNCSYYPAGFPIRCALCSCRRGGITSIPRLVHRIAERHIWWTTLGTGSCITAIICRGIILAYSWYP